MTSFQGTLTATYTQEGDLSVEWPYESDDKDLGTFDADGGEWVEHVDAMLTAEGYKRVTDWDGDTCQVIDQDMPYLINLTPHPICLLGSTGTLEIPSSGVARVAEQRINHQPIHVHGAGNVPFCRVRVDNNIVGLPDAWGCVYYIVSAYVKQAAPVWRTDLLIPADLIRDEQGRIIGCGALSD
jgi:hypothetical protein